MQIKQALIRTVKKLKKNNIPNPHLEAEILLSFVLDKSREFILTHPEKRLSKKQISNIQYLISKRQKGVPIAYLIGHKQFYGLDFYVNKNVLIPRPETELIVDEAINLLRSKLRNKQKIIVIDIGTGTGCIIITLAKLLKKNIQYPCLAGRRAISNIQYLATDISRPALAIARQNAKLHKVNNKIKFLLGDLLKPIISKPLILNFQSEIIITANLPYLTPGQIKNSPTIKYEPKLALLAGSDGLKYYRQLIKQIKKLHSTYPLPFSLFFEINPEQTKKIKLIIKKHFPLAKIKIKKDLAGRNRLVIVKQK